MVMKWTLLLPFLTKRHGFVLLYSELELSMSEAQKWRKHSRFEIIGYGLQRSSSRSEIRSKLEARFGASMLLRLFTGKPIC